MSKRFLATFGAAALLSMGGAQAAHASGGNPTPNVPNGCPTGISYSTSPGTTGYRDAVNPAYFGPGVAGSIAISSGHQVATTVGGSVTVEANALIASAQTSVNASISYTWTANTTYTGSSAAQSYAYYLHGGAATVNYTWNKYQDNANCTETLLGSGSANSPYAEPAFWVTSA